MGRKLRGAALRAKKRADESVLEILQGQAQEVQGAPFAAKTDEELFVVDTTAVLPSQKQLAKKAVKRQKQQRQTAQASSAKEQRQIDKLIHNHTPAQLQVLAQQAAGNRVPRIKAPVAPSTFDLWTDDVSDKKKIKKAQTGDVSATTTTTTTTMMTKSPAGIKPSSHVQIRSRAALPDPSKTNHKKQPQRHPSKVTVDVAKSGQSYNPDVVEHQKVLQQALLVETKRLAAEQEAKAKVSQGLRHETKALLLGDDDDDTSDSEDDDNDYVNDDDDVLNRNMELAKRPEKLTRAQRNKQKRLRQEAHEIHERKRQKKLQNTVEEARGIARKLRKQEEAAKAQKEALEALKVATARTPGRDVYQHLATEHPLTAPTFPVALPPTGGGSSNRGNSSSLRTLRPKGSLVTDRMISLTDRDMAVKRAVKQKRRVEGKRRKVRVRGKGYEVTKQGEILG